MANAGLDYTFRCGRGQGAMLILRGAGSKTSTISKDFVPYVRRNHEQWYEFATEVLRLSLQPEDIIVVHGLVKTNAWALAAYSEDGNTTHEVSFSSQVSNGAALGFRYLSSQHSTMLFQHRIGPHVSSSQSGKQTSTRLPASAADIEPAESRLGSGESGSGAVSAEHDPATSSMTGQDVEPAPVAPAFANQCVFLKRYKIKYRIFNLKFIAGAAELSKPRHIEPFEPPPQCGISSDDHETFDVASDSDTVSASIRLPDTLTTDVDGGGA